MRVVRVLAEVAGAVEQAAARGGLRVRRRDGVLRAVRRDAAGTSRCRCSATPTATSCVLGDRDCSVQRRHQKVVEEAPAPGLDRRTIRGALHAAARARGRGDRLRRRRHRRVPVRRDDRRFWFLEMNTRLQVEHPVTELRHRARPRRAAARGRRGPAASPAHGASRPAGHAVEVRLYAEDPAARLAAAERPAHPVRRPGRAASSVRCRATGIRLDAGFVAGDEVGTHYDAMLAKVIAWAPTRDEALPPARRGAASAPRSTASGTNRDLLVEVLRHPRVPGRATLSTDFLDRHDLAALPPRAGDPARLHACRVRRRGRARRSGPGPRARTAARIPAGWRNVVSQPQRTAFELDGDGGGGRVVRRPATATASGDLARRAVRR